MPLLKPNFSALACVPHLQDLPIVQAVGEDPTVALKFAQKESAKAEFSGYVLRRVGSSYARWAKQNLGYCSHFLF